MYDISIESKTLGFVTITTKSFDNFPDFLNYYDRGSISAIDVFLKTLADLNPNNIELIALLQKQRLMK